MKQASASLTKDTNPKTLAGSSKYPMSVVPANVLAELSVAMLEGALKYGRHNYRAMGVTESIYYDATMRHLQAYWEGEDIDPASGQPHLIKAMASLAVWRDAKARGMATDDRPPPTEFSAEVQARMEELMRRMESVPRAKTHFTAENTPKRQKKKPATARR